MTQVEPDAQQQGNLAKYTHLDKVTFSTLNTALRLTEDEKESCSLLRLKSSRDQNTDNVDAINRHQSRGLIVTATILLLAIVMVLTWLIVSHAELATSPSQLPEMRPSPPASEQQGHAREARVRAKLREEGYEQPFGDNDQLIRQHLQLKPGQKVADFVGRSADGERYLVAESKGNDLGKAFRQLEDTANALWNKNVGATQANTEFRIYVNETTWSKLQLGADASRTGGYTLYDGYLASSSGLGSEALEFVLVEGKRYWF